MSKHLSAFSVLFLLFLLKTQAQSSFQKATIINNKNDTVEGYIKFEDWYADPSFIVFKKTLNSDKKTILPTDIKSFRVNGELYESHTVKLQEDLKETVDEKPLMGFIVSRDTTVFLRCLTKGSWQLYSHTIGEIGDDKFAFYMRQEDSDTLELLKYQKFAEVQKGQVIVGTKSIFRRQLRVNLSDYPKLLIKVNRAEYTTADIQALVVAYNSHFADSIPVSYIARSEKHKFVVGFLAGGNYSFLNIISDPTYFTGRRVPNQTMTGFGFDFGISTQYVLARRFNRYALTNDLVFKTTRLSNNVAQGSTITQTNFDNSYLRLYSQGRFLLFQYKNWDIFGSIGIVQSYTLKTTNSFTKTNGGNIYTDAVFPKGDFKQFNFGGVVGGLSLKLNQKLMCNLSIETNKGMSPYLTVSTRLTNVNMWLTYTL